MVWAKGDQLQEGKYIIHDELGEGGFGTTYKVWHTHFERYFVIKTIKEKLRNEPKYQDVLRKFKREAKMLLALSHQSNPHIVRVSDFFKEGETYCLAMDYIEGKSLWDLVKKEGKIPQKKAFKYIGEMVTALSTVHAIGSTHRDVHPGNIMIDSSDRAILIDFGLTKDINPNPSTSIGLGGNLAYVSYEQFIQGSREPTVDVYSLAASFYVILTGRLPANSLERMNGNDLIPPRRLESSISRKVDNAILAGMALEAKHRPQSMQSWWKLFKAESEVSPQGQPVKHSSEKKRTVVPVATQSATQEIEEIKKNPNKKPGTLDKILSSPHIWGWLLVNVLSYGAIFFYLVPQVEAKTAAIALSGVVTIVGGLGVLETMFEYMLVEETKKIEIDELSTLFLPPVFEVISDPEFSYKAIRAKTISMVVIISMFIAAAEVMDWTNVIFLGIGVATLVITTMDDIGTKEVWNKASFNRGEIFWIFLCTNLLGVDLGWFVYSYLV